MEVSTAAQVFYKSFKTLFILSSIIISIHGTWCLYDVHTCAYPLPRISPAALTLWVQSFTQVIIGVGPIVRRPDSPKAQ